MKRILNKLCVVAAALVMVLTFTQCAKDTLRKNLFGKVEVSLTATKGDMTRTELEADGANMTVTWSEGDKLYAVGATDGLLGYLTLKSGKGTATATFGGTLDYLSAKQNVHFYYVGTNKEIKSGTDTYAFDLSKQAGTLDVIEDSLHVMCGTLTDVNPATVNFGAVAFENLISIVKVDTKTTFGEVSGIKLGGTCARASIDLKSATATPAVDTITLTGNASENFYIALLPNESEQSYNFVYNGVKAFIPAKTIVEGKYYTNNGGAVALNIVKPDLLPGKFSVGPNLQVQFSKGNLFYNGSTYEFENEQYDYPTTWKTSHVGHFFWTKNTETSIIPYDASYGTPVPANAKEDILFTNSTKTTPNASFTVSGQTGVWRSLSGSSAEWKYLVEGRADAITKVGLATVFGIKGMILLPDTFTDPKTNTATGSSDGSFVPKSKSQQFTANNYSYSNWEAMESAGAVFLPASGVRQITGITVTETAGYYWPSDADGASTASRLDFSVGNITFGTLDRGNGQAIRLVQDVNDKGGYTEDGWGYGPGIEINGVVWAPVNCGSGYKYAYPEGLYYQWGRKYGQTFKTTNCSNALAASLAEGNLEANKDLFYTNNSSIDHWYTGSSITDVWTENPCPTGWRVPTSSELNSLSGVKTDWVSNGGYQKSQAGVVLRTTTDTLFIPLVGYHNHQSKSSLYSTTLAALWSTDVFDGSKSYSFKFNNSAGTHIIDPATKDPRGYAFSVRCVLTTSSATASATTDTFNNKIGW